jgi:hypothetical protein
MGPTLSGAGLFTTCGGHGLGGAPTLLGRSYRDHRLRVSEPVGIDQVEAVDRVLIECSSRLSTAIANALGPQVMSIEAQLR